MHADPSRLTASHPARENPHWVVTYGGKLFYNPGLPEVRAFVEDAMLDAVAKYRVDGVHFDDYFYPYPVAGQTFDDDAAYDEHGGGFPDRAAWRRDNIDRLVRETADRVKEVRPDARFGISPFGVWRNAGTDPLGSDTEAGVETYDDLHADTRKWVREGWIDYIVPQLYWNIGFAAADYAKLVPWWAEVARGSSTQLYVGEALYKAGDPAQPAAWQQTGELSRHLTLAGEHAQVRGHVYFAAKDVAADRIGAMARVVADHYGQPAPPRAESWPGGGLPVPDLGVGSRGAHALVPVLEPDAVRGVALRAEHFDDLADPVVLTDHPAVLDKLVAHGCEHLGPPHDVRSSGPWPLSLRRGAPVGSGRARSRSAA